MQCKNPTLSNNDVSKIIEIIEKRNFRNLDALKRKKNFFFATVAIVNDT